MKRNDVADVRVPSELLNERFFGPFYYRGDHSFEGFLPNRPLTNQQRTNREINGIVRLLRLTPTQGVPILDAPCGYGRHLVELAKRGYKMSGLDLSETFVDVARRALQAETLKADVRQGELAELPFNDESFDVVLNLFFAFGFYDSDAKNLACLGEFARVIRPGGRLLFHTDVNVSQFANDTYRQPTVRNLEDGATLRIDERFDSDTRRLVGSWTLEEEERFGTNAHAHKRRYSMRVYTSNEFCEMCRRTGFSDVALFGSFDEDDSRYTEKSDEMIVVATK